jgi:hypothetical protein
MIYVPIKPPPKKPDRDPGHQIRDGGIGDTVSMAFVFLAIILIFAAFLVGYLVLSDSVNVDGRCLRLGYPKVQYDGNTPYCYRFIDGSQEVVPLRELENR